MYLKILIDALIRNTKARDIPFDSLDIQPCSLSEKMGKPPVMYVILQDTTTPLGFYDTELEQVDFGGKIYDLTDVDERTELLSIISGDEE